MDYNQIESRVEGLLGESGIEARPRQALLRALATNVSVDDLVALSGLTPRVVGQVLAVVEPWIVRRGERLRLQREAYQRISALVRESRVDLTIDASAALQRRPRANLSRDQVGCTAETLAHRARYLLKGYELSGARVVFLGDRDMTAQVLIDASHALGVAVEVDVVDIDEAVLEAAGKGRTGYAPRRWFADYRIGTPLALQHAADLVFCDPPYTPPGVTAALATAVGLLRFDRPARVLFCYGAAGHRPDLALRIQYAVVRLGLVISELHRGFNVYDRASAIGGQSDLYICVPTPRARREAERARPRIPAAIYSQGPSALNAPAEAPVIGRLRKLMRGPGQHEREVTLNIGESFQELGPRLLLAVNADQLALRSTRAIPRRWREAVAAKWTIAQHREADTWMIRALRTPDQALRAADAGARYLLEHAHAKLGNAITEALIISAQAYGQELTRRQSAERALALAPADGRLLDLPFDDVSRILSIV